MTTGRGCPDCLVMIPDIDQPPTAPSTKRFIFFPIQRFFPTGTSTMVASTSRCVASLALTAHSFFKRSSCCGLPTVYPALVLFKLPTKGLKPAEELSVAFENV